MGNRTAAFDLLFGLLVPPRCGCCGERCPVDRELCRRCELDIGSLRGQALTLAGIDAAWAAGPYEATSRRLVAAMKFGHRLGLGKVAASALAEGASPGLLRGAIAPVPADPVRSRLRGFDGAEEIAVHLARLSGLPTSSCLARSPGPRQVGRSRTERLRAPPRIRTVGAVPAEVVLVDDVVTTGATLAACGRALRQGGAVRVVAVAFARSGVGSC